MAETRNPEPEVEDPSDGVEVDRLVMANLLQGSNSNHIMSQLQIADDKFSRGDLDKAMKSY
eukprot:1839953-Ditylum_brightwellii.AAC.1